MDRKGIDANEFEASDALYSAGERENSILRQATSGMRTVDVSRMVNSEILIKGAAAEDVNAATKLKSAFIDPYNLLDFLGSRAKPSRITWQILRRMAISCKPVAAIIQTRMNQVSAFTQTPRRIGDIGFRVTTRNPLKKPTQGDLERISEVTEWLLNIGYDQYDERFYDGERRRDNFDIFMRKAVRDTLTLDAVCWEVQRNARGEPHAMWPVDPSTIKYAAEKYQWDPRTGLPIPESMETTNGLPVRYVQELYSGQRVAVFNDRELIYGVRNPRSDIDIGGYGLGELEILMETVTQTLFAEQYNSKYFSQNSLPQGVLNISGKYTAEALEAFKRQWIAQVSGVANAWKIPIMAIDESQGGVNFVPFKESNRNMQFNLWLEYLIQTACGIYTIDPSEIGFAIKGSGGGPMVEHSGAVRLEYSKDKGLRPLLKFFAHLINDNIVKELYPDLFFEWVGIDAMSEKDKLDLMGKKLSDGIITVNEARALEDLEPIDANWANAPASPALMQVYMADMNHQREQEAAAAAPPPMAPGTGAEGDVQAPAIPGSSKEAPLSPREPSPKDNGVKMPLPTTAKKETNDGAFERAREEERRQGAKKREFEHLGMNVNKSFGDDDVVEIVVE